MASISFNNRIAKEIEEIKAKLIALESVENRKGLKPFLAIALSKNTTEELPFKQFEIEGWVIWVGKNAKNNDNNINNLVASCYYCNNDKSNTISSQIFKNYFGPDKGKSFSDLFKINNFTLTGELRHHFKNNKK